MDIDTQHAFRLGADERALGILDVREDGQAMLVVGLTVELAWRVVRAVERTPRRASSLTAFVTVDRGRPVSSAASVKLCLSTTRGKTHMASNLSI